MLRREMHNVRVEMATLREQQGGAPTNHPPPPPASQAPGPSPTYAQEQRYQGPPPPQQQQHQHQPQPQQGGADLPPLRSISNGIPPSAGPDSMTGVQYDANPQQPNGYRNERY